MVLRLLENEFVTQNIESIHYYSWPQALQAFIITSQAEENYQLSSGSILGNIYCPQQKGGREKNYDQKKWPKLTLSGYEDNFLLNPTIFSLFIFLVSVLFCYNLDSSMLKCEGSLA